METMHDRLRKARLAHYRHATKAADALGMPRTTYAAYENGQNEYGPDQAMQFAKLFKVDSAWLLFGDSHQSRTPDLPTPPDPDMTRAERVAWYVSELLREEPSFRDLVVSLVQSLEKQDSARTQEHPERHG